MATDSVPVARPRQAALAALAGTSIEWYDFFIYATAAALVFRGVFFPPDLDPVLGTIVSFGTTSFGYLGRPLGAFIFGHLGDRYGRKPVLVATLLLMGTGTFGIGLLPSYASVGAIAPLLLILLRLLQGVAMGGEWGGAALLAIEHAPADRRSFFGSFAQLGSSVGATLSAAAFAVSEHIGGGITAGSWRISFLPLCSARRDRPHHPADCGGIAGVRPRPRGRGTVSRARAGGDAITEAASRGHRRDARRNRRLLRHLVILSRLRL